MLARSPSSMAGQPDSRAWMRSFAASRPPSDSSQARFFGASSAPDTMATSSAAAGGASPSEPIAIRGASGGSQQRSTRGGAASSAAATNPSESASTTPAKMPRTPRPPEDPKEHRQNGRGTKGPALGGPLSGRVRAPSPPPRRRRHPVLALEGAMERGLGVVADRRGDLPDRFVTLAQAQRGELHAPAREIAHRRLAEQRS